MSCMNLVLIFQDKSREGRLVLDVTDRGLSGRTSEASDRPLRSRFTLCSQRRSVQGDRLPPLSSFFHLLINSPSKCIRSRFRETDFQNFPVRDMSSRGNWIATCLLCTILAAYLTFLSCASIYQELLVEKCRGLYSRKVSQKRVFHS